MEGQCRAVTSKHMNSDEMQSVSHKRIIMWNRFDIQILTVVP